MEQDSSARVAEVTAAIIELVHGKMNEPCDVDEITATTRLGDLGLGSLINKQGIAHSICGNDNFVICEIYPSTYNAWQSITEIIATVMAEEPEESAAAG